VASAETRQDDEDENDEQKMASATRQDIHNAAAAMVSLVEVPMFHVSDESKDVKPSLTRDKPEETQDAVKQRRASLCKQKARPLPKRKNRVAKKPRKVPPPTNKNEKEDSNSLPTRGSSGDPELVLCTADESCYNPGRRQMVIISGKGFNGQERCMCRQACHFVCLFELEDDMYCKKCYNENVVAKCNTDTLFDDLFQNDDLKRGAVPSKQSHKHCQLLQFVDNYLLKSHKLMSTHQLKKCWRKERHELIEFKLDYVKGWTHEDKKTEVGRNALHQSKVQADVKIGQRRMATID
jgi:hypothetical protein